ncbi:MAG: biotin/lipoyl-containing protein, partial [Nitrolancea sp.]
MAKTLVMPQMGYDMDAGTLLRWLKQEGEEVERGEPIAEIETDKVNLEIESFDSGVVRKHLVTEGQTVPVGEAIAIIGSADEPLDLPDLNGKEPESAPKAAPPAQAETQEPVTSAVSQPEAASPNQQAQPQDQVIDRAPVERVRASPLV